MSWALGPKDSHECETLLWRMWLPFFFPFIFNWKRIALQRHVGFCHTTPRISHKHRYIPPLLSLPPAPPHPCRSSRSSEFGSLSSSSFPLARFSTWWRTYISAPLPVHPTVSFPAASTSLHLYSCPATDACLFPRPRVYDHGTGSDGGS